MTDDLPHRRSSDDRVERIEQKVDRILEKLEDPDASALGRILRDRADRNERNIEGLTQRVDELERDRDRATGAMAFVKGVQVVMAILVALLALYVAFRQGVG